VEHQAAAALAAVVVREDTLKDLYMSTQRPTRLPWEVAVPHLEQMA
jgi:hypothetical protein